MEHQGSQGSDEALKDVALVGIYRDGDKFVLIDAKGDEHEASDAAGLWSAFDAIMRDPQIPKTPTHIDVQHEAEQVVSVAIDETERWVSDNYGRLAGRMARAATMSGGKSVVSFLRRMSRS